MISFVVVAVSAAVGPAVAEEGADVHDAGIFRVERLQFDVLLHDLDLVVAEDVPARRAVELLGGHELGGLGAVVAALWSAVGDDEGLFELALQDDVGRLVARLDDLDARLLWLGVLGNGGLAGLYVGDVPFGPHRRCSRSDR